MRQQVTASPFSLFLLAFELSTLPFGSLSLAFVYLDTKARWECGVIEGGRTTRYSYPSPNNFALFFSLILLASSMSFSV